MAEPVDNRATSLPSADSAYLAVPVATPSTSTAAFPVAGIGASAGGLEACTQVLAHLPAGVGLALVQHLDPTHASILPELLSRATTMPVRQVQYGTAVEPSRVYVVPPNVTMTIAGGILRLAPRLKAPGP